ncbi:hypothetical protein EZV73_12405 [Acidaminobacter sp. JC074]|uniref:hypothetical protein n=1 Tax=Acidaminobacter sp. JC074 TaxID=2530199 RepID=UPI001F0EA2EC|nr:hypothetical protein [Acidaminobacter sp. JC074]MCH4888384.1 hypothetical protein [Acidaminobacter sp. JC074]
MNKIKTVYDIVQVMRKREQIEGTFKCDVLKDGENIFETENEFKKDLNGGKSFVKSKMVYDHDGVKVKNEFESEGDFEKEMHRGHHFRGHHFRNHDECQAVGCREPLKKLSMLLDLLNKLELEAVDDKKKFRLDLDIKDYETEMMSHRMHQRQMKAMQDFKTFESGRVTITGFISQGHVIRNMEISFTGSYLDLEDQSHDLVVNAFTSMEE